MVLTFIDEAGNEGRITADLSVVYEGQHAVEEYVDLVIDETRSFEENVETIIIELGDQLHIQEVKRANRASSSRALD